MNARNPHEMSRTASGPTYVAVQPDGAPSFWQPVPANGYTTVMLSGEQTVSGNVSMGTQTVAVGGFVREHAHPAQEELIYVLEGSGIALIQDVEHPMVRGALFYFGPNTRHKFVNTGTTPLTFAWTMLPAGLEKFFEGIGRPRNEGEPAPLPFPRPADVGAIELGTVFADLEALKAAQEKR
jgi:quercetin dioxygenase-like cupin family protein